MSVQDYLISQETKALKQVAEIAINKALPTMLDVCKGMAAWLSGQSGGKKEGQQTLKDLTAHIHNHIVINSVNLDCTGKYRDIKHSWKRSIQKISDRICKENGLYTVENPAFGKGYNLRYKVPTKRDGLAGVIDDVLANDKPKDFDDFLKLLVKAGCKVKLRGKTISIQPPNAERFFRLKAGKKGLPVGYDEESLRKKIADMQTDIPAELRDDVEEILTAADTKTIAAAIPAQPTMPSHDKKINLIIDLENSLKAARLTELQKVGQRL